MGEKRHTCDIPLKRKTRKKFYDRCRGHFVVCVCVGGGGERTVAGRIDV